MSIRVVNKIGSEKCQNYVETTKTKSAELGGKAGVDVLWVGERRSRWLVGDASIGGRGTVDLDVGAGADDGLIASIGVQVLAKLLLEQGELDIGTFAGGVDEVVGDRSYLLLVLAEQENDQEQKATERNRATNAQNFHFEGRRFGMADGSKLRVMVNKRRGLSRIIYKTCGLPRVGDGGEDGDQRSLNIFSCCFPGERAIHLSSQE